MRKSQLGLAGLPDFRERIFVFLRRLPVAEGGGFRHGLFELGADVGGQAVPELLVDDGCVGQVAVVDTEADGDGRRKRRDQVSERSRR